MSSTQSPIRELLANAGLWEQDVHPARRTLLERLRSLKGVLGVWDGEAWRYPVFQFAADGRPHAKVRELLAEVPPADTHGRRAFLWLSQPHPRLEGKTPCEEFSTKPEKVIALAREFFEINEGDREP